MLKIEKFLPQHLDEVIEISAEQFGVHGWQADLIKEELQKEIFAVSEKIYKAANPQGAEGAPTGDTANADPNVYEADFTDVDDSNK